MAVVTGVSVSLGSRPCKLGLASISTLRSVSLSSQRKSNLSFKLHQIPSRLKISCAAKPETVDKVCEIVKEQLSLADDQNVTAETKFSDLGADSLDTVEIVMGLEEEFEITMAEEKAQMISTVEEAADLIDELVKEKAL